MNNQLSVLYVEDDPQSRKLMRLLLEVRMGLTQVTIFENSDKFLARLETLEPKPDVILLDIHMKPIDGFDMLNMLHQLEWTQGRPIVALTASVMNEEVQKLKTAGFDGCLAKPINLSTFPDTFEQIINGETVWRILEY